MIWSSDVKRRLRDLRQEAIIRFDGFDIDLDDLRAKLRQARDAFLALRDEVVAARGEHDTLADRLDAIEARLDALETPPE